MAIVTTNQENLASSSVLWGHDRYWNSLRLRERAAILFRTLADYAVVPSRRRAMRKIFLAEQTEPRPLTNADVPLIVVVRNEVDRLEPFLRHYRAIGVTRFLAVDDRSTDGSCEFLAAQTDVSLFTSNVRYGEARKGELWRQALAERFGLDRWYVSVDIDEFLVYDGMERHSLRALASVLQARGLKRSLAAMVDLYPPGQLSRSPFDARKAPWDIADLMDSDGYRARVARTSIEITGGPLLRFFRWPGNRTKFPLLYWDRFTFLAKTIHSPLPYWRNFDPPFIALMHVKLFSDFEQKCIEGIEDGQRHLGARAYKAYYSRMKEVESVSIDYAGSVAYHGPQALIDHGFMSKVDWRER